MGCDIHAHSEIKISGQWHHMSTLSINRDYGLFCRMAGVRGGYENSPEPISEPRGVPEDVSFLTKFICDDYGADGHSHSWLSAEEVCRVGEWLENRRREMNPNDWFVAEQVFGWIFGNGWDLFTKYREDLPEGVEDGRIVFWFDN